MKSGIDEHLVTPVARSPRKQGLRQIYSRVFANSTGVMLAYRSNLIFFLLFETFFLTSSFLGAGLGVSLAGGSINGWTRDQIFALTAINGLSHQVFICFFIAPIFNLPDFIWTGRMDYVLQKPLHPLFSLMASSEIIVSNLPNLFINMTLAVYFLWAGSATDITATTLVLPAYSWLIFSVLCILSLLVRIALALFFMSPAFFAERLVEGDVGFWAVAGTGRFPTSVFPKVVERILLYVIPLAMMAAVPAAFIFERLGIFEVLLSAAASMIFVGGALAFFAFAVQNYKSVNSGM